MTQEKQKVVLLGAGGKMGCRITPNIRDREELDITYIEISEQGKKRLEELGVLAVSDYGSISDADIVIFAVPDILIGKISKEVVPLMKPGATVIGLDPAAHYGGVMQVREDLKYFVVHPCHPSLFPFEENLSLAAQKDWFGGNGAASMALVCAVFKGDQEDYEQNEKLAKEMFHPISASYQVSVEQMILLEPALVESITAPLVKGMKMAVDACISKGVPKDVAMAFVMGHLKVQFGVIFGYAGFSFSDGANLALDRAMDVIFKPNWIENIMNTEAIHQSVYEITHELNGK